ncbi:NUDIX domain-containing protein [Candidatus Palauibacter sp.]|uniref:NUDIX domain-containing protein n=1 Tax=Candidatus Palauibacter sp. TaxID=3101350 RepID=UPI003B59CB56
MTGDGGPGARPPRPALALVIEDPASAGGAPRWLLVRRPDDDPDLPGVWGLPAGSHAEGETDEALVRRIGREKLGVETEDLGRLSEGHLDRTGYRLEMRLHAARIVAREPRVPQPVPGVTQYSEWDWKPPVELRDGARRGSLCCRLALALDLATDGRDRVRA